MTRVGRNQPCPCGSGRKYKQCHGRPTRGPASPDDTWRSLRRLTDSLLDPSPPVLQNADGEDLVFHRLDFEIDSAQEAFDRLSDLAFDATPGELLETAEYDEEGRLQHVSFVWTVGGDGGLQTMGSTVHAHLDIDGSRLVAKVNSAERAARFRRLVEDRLGPRARHLGTDVESIDDLKNEARSGAGSVEPLGEDPLFPTADSTLRVSFITVDSGDDLTIGYAVDLDDPDDIASLILLRTPKYEFLLPPHERGVSVSWELDSDDGGLLRRASVRGAQVELETRTGRYRLDLTRVDEMEARDALAVLKRMHAHGGFELVLGD